MKLIKEIEDKKNYRISFKSYRTSKQQSVFISFIRQLTDKEATKINSSVGKLVAGSVGKDTQASDEDLYIIKIYFYRVNLYNIKYALLSKKEFEEAKQYEEKLGTELFNIKLATSKDIVKIIKREEYEGGEVANYISSASLKNNLELLDRNKGHIEIKPKDKLYNEPGGADKEKKDEKEPDVKDLQKQKDIKKDDPKKLASEIFFDDDVEKYYNLSVRKYNNWKDPKSPNRGNPEIKQEYLSAIDKMIDKVNELTDNNDVKLEFINYILANKLSHNQELLKIIKSEFANKIKMKISESKKRMKEMSGTGGAGGSVAAPGSAHSTAGSGEGMATKFAFGGAGYDPDKKKKRKKRKIKEQEAVLQDLPKGDDSLAKAKRATQLLINRFLGITFEECIDNPSILEKLYNDMENAYKVISKEANKYEDTDEKLFEQLDDLSMQIVHIQNVLSDLEGTFEKAEKNYFKL